MSMIRSFGSNLSAEFWLVPSGEIGLGQAGPRRLVPSQPFLAAGQSNRIMRRVIAMQGQGRGNPILRNQDCWPDWLSSLLLDHRNKWNNGQIFSSNNSAQKCSTQSFASKLMMMFYILRPFQDIGTIFQSYISLQHHMFQLLLCSRDIFKTNKRKSKNVNMVKTGKNHCNGWCRLCKGAWLCLVSLLHNSDLSGGHNLQIIMNKPRRNIQLWGCRAYDYACTTAVLCFWAMKT